MPTPSEETVRRVLSINDRGISLRRVVEKAWLATKNNYPDRAWWRRKSTQAHLVWEHCVNFAIEAFENDEGVQTVNHHDTVSFVVDDTVLLRFKKADIKLQTKNYPTLLATLFHEHEIDLFGHEGFHRVEVAHVFDRFGTEVYWIGIVARAKGQLLWHFELGAGGAAVETLPLPDTLAPAANRVVRHKLSNNDIHKQDSE